VLSKKKITDFLDELGLFIEKNYTDLELDCNDSIEFESVEGRSVANFDFYYENLKSIPSLVAWNKNVFFQDVDCGRTVTKIRA
jgi:hypothetical protein